jgi:hypothetical protein
MKLTGYDAINYADRNDFTLSKYADPIEDGREGLTPDEAREIASEDPSLIYLDVAVSAADLVLCKSDHGDGGWSLHAPGSTDEDIACGDAPYLVSGEGYEPTAADYDAAMATLAARAK